MKNSPIRNLALSAMFVSLGLLLPFLTGQVPSIGNMLLPMHLPVFLCALICGWKYGVVVGLVTPLLRSLIFSMPPLYPVAIAMAFELATYGFVAGIIYDKSRSRHVSALYQSLISSMILGRIVWGIAMLVLLGLRGGSFTWQAFIAGAFTTAIPGIILQLILIPIIMLALHRTGAVHARREE